MKHSADGVASESKVRPHRIRVGMAGLVVIGTSTVALWATRVQAQTNDTGPAEQGHSAPEVEEVIVTAQRRSENLQTVPISIAAMSDKALTSRGITNTQELASAVPGLELTTAVGNTQVFIRGIGTTALTVENDVGVYVDGVYIASQAASLLDLTNIDHVEVLKGPQGTLFGRNAIGGALQIVTKAPSQAPSADFTLGYANYDTVTGNFYGTTGLGPTLAADLAVYYSNQGNGWGHNLTTGNPIFRARTLNIRNKWLFTPADTTKITLAFDYSHDENQLGDNWRALPGTLGVDGASTFPGFYNSTADARSENNAKAWGSMLRVDQDLSWARGVSITSYRVSTNHDYIDQDATPAPIVAGGPTPLDDRSFSQELQLLSGQDSKVTWILGAFYLYDRFYTPGFNIFELAAPTIPPEITHVNFIVKEPTRSYAGFGQATGEILPDTHLTAGVRYTKDDKSISGQLYQNGVQLPPIIPGVTDPCCQDTTFSAVTYRGVLDHQFTPDVFGYVSFDTGFKSGQYNLLSFATPPVKPEHLHAWQAGTKTEFLDHRLRLNVAGFYYQYKNIQITEIVPGGDEVLNAAAAKLYGADIDVNALVTSNFQVQGALSLLHGRYTDFPNAPSYVPATTIVNGQEVLAGGNTEVAIPDAKGYTTVESPTTTAYLAATYSIPFVAGKLELNANGSYNSGYYWNPDNRIKQPAYALLNAYAKWTTSSGLWDVQFWGNNVTGKQYYSYESAYALGNIGSAAAPATYGIRAGVHF